jgi:hypothetical protein
MTIDLRSLGTDAVETVSKDVHYRVENVFGRVTERQDGPQVFLVRQGANDTTAPHYHEVPQYQVFTGGSGRFGRAEVEMPAIHYADAWTSYGPIVAGSEGIDYFTARVSSDVGANYMPESRLKKTHRSGRHFTIGLDGGTPETGGIQILIDRHDDGLAAYRIDLEPGESLEPPEFVGSGRLITVLGGSLFSDGREFAQWSWGHVTDAGTVPGCTAGAAGASVLCFDYPTRA